METAQRTLRNLSPRGRVVVAGVAFATLLLVFFLFKMATAPSYDVLLTGLDPAQTGDITKKLDEKGIGYELQSGGTVLAVEKAKKTEARIVVAEAGGGVGGAKPKPGFELFDKQKLGASDFQQKVSYQRALEGELARTIGQVDGVKGATVSLTLPDDQLFAEESKQATAAVLLSGADGLEPGSVRGVARMVASSVEGLKPSNVTITDSTGALLWPTGESGEGGGTSKLAVEQRYERTTEANLAGLLARTVGPEKARVQVQADLNADQSTQDKLEYATKGTPLKSKTENEKLAGGAGGAGGASGTAGNIPSYAQGGAAGGSSNYERKTDETDYGVNKTVTRTKIATGTINRQDVALVVDRTVPGDEVRELESAVAAAAGIDTQRGDTLSTSRISFAKPQAAPGASAMPVAGIGKWVALGLGSLVFLFFAARALRRRQEDVLDSEPVWLRELNQPTTLAELDTTERVPLAARTAPQVPDLKLEVEELVSAQPERVAQQVRAWMNDE